VSRIA